MKLHLLPLTLICCLLFLQACITSEGELTIISTQKDQMQAIDTDIQPYHDHLLKDLMLIDMSLKDIQVKDLEIFMDMQVGIDMQGIANMQVGIDMQGIADMQVGTDMQDIVDMQVGIDMQGIADMQLGIDMQGIVDMQVGMDMQGIADMNLWINECMQMMSPCPSNAMCIDLADGYRCECPTGFIFDQQRCRAMDECINILSCGMNQECKHINGQDTCVCQAGYQDNHDGSCIDVNECVSSAGPCGTNQRCENTMGGYQCFCSDGYEQTTAGECVDINECVQGQLNSCAPHMICQNQPGSYTCICAMGYQIGITGGCEDIDECMGSVNQCSTGELCFNYEGSYLCTTCSNGQIDQNEQCDDGNLLNFDGCSEQCQREGCYDAFEPNDIQNQAVKLWVSNQIYEANACLNNNDWYFVDVPANARIHLTIQGQGNILPLIIDAYQQDNTAIPVQQMMQADTYLISYTAGIYSERISFKIRANSNFANQFNLRNANNPYTIQAVFNNLNQSSLCSDAIENQILYDQQECLINVDRQNINECDYTTCLTVNTPTCKYADYQISFKYSDQFKSNQDLCVSSFVNANNLTDSFSFNACEGSIVNISFTVIDDFGQRLNEVVYPIKIELIDKSNTILMSNNNGSASPYSGQISFDYAINGIDPRNRNIKVNISLDNNINHLGAANLIKYKYIIKLTQRGCFLRFFQ